MAKRKNKEERFQEIINKKRKPVKASEIAFVLLYRYGIPDLKDWCSGWYFLNDVAEADRDLKRIIDLYLMTDFKYISADDKELLKNTTGHGYCKEYLPFILNNAVRNILLDVIDLKKGAA